MPTQIYLNQKKTHKKYGGFIFENCLKLCCISPSSTLIKKKLFQIGHLSFVVFVKND